MADRFDQCIGFILKAEGGYVDDPADPGGATNFGISLRFYREKIKTSATKADIQKLSQQDAIVIYKTYFWLTTGCDRMPAGVDLLMFDMAVNQGPGTAIRTLQRALGYPAASVDGVYGPATQRDAYAKMGAPLISEITARRIVHYGESSLFQQDGLGWVRRALAAQAYANTLI